MLDNIIITLDTEVLSDDDKGYLMREYPPAEVRDLPEISVGQAHSLKAELSLWNTPIKVWWNRCWEEGYEGQVSIEALVTGRWLTVFEYSDPELEPEEE